MEVGGDGSLEGGNREEVGRMEAKLRERPVSGE